MQETVRLSGLIGPGFYSSHRAVSQGATELVESGGRGSGKSSFLSVELVLQLLKHPQCHAVVLRRVGATLRTSVYPQVLWAVEAMGLKSRFKCSLSPLECQYLPTGQKILFLGMDDPGKLKSLKMPFGHVGILWFEELDQFEEEQVRSAEQSLLRGGQFSLTLKSFNPPPDAGHWVNLLGKKQGSYRHHSTYLELPEDWLGPRFLDDARHWEKVNPVMYRHEYLGQSVGTGDRVFPNVKLESLEDRAFPHSIAGVDWGWWPDPWAFNRMYYDGAHRCLYIFDEATRHRTSNLDTAALVLGRIRPGETVVADSSEAKSIADYRTAGIRCRAAVKGPGSVGYSIKWLQSLDAIVIDPGRCPDTAREFATCVYVQGQIPDRDNHHIDAVRYAVGHLWRRGGS